jgi:exodeoxyribonuclease VII large subunit
VANAIRGFNAFSPGGAMPRPDVLIVARGGGSLEDLWSFNDEAVVRAASESAIPLISAVGHETDWTLIDYAADVRAPTPTGAAEMAVPVKAELEAQTSALAARLQTSMSRHMDQRRQSVRALLRALPSLDQLLALPRRRFDEVATGLGRGLELNTLNKRRAFERAASHLRPQVLSNWIAEKRQVLNERIVRAERRVDRLLSEGRRRISNAETSMRGVPGKLFVQTTRSRDHLGNLTRHSDTAIRHMIAQARGVIVAQERVLKSLSYKNVLARGYAVIRDDENRPVASASALAAGAAISIEFADGNIDAVTGEGPPPSAGGAVPRKRPPKGETLGDPPKQGSLF